MKHMKELYQLPARERQGAFHHPSRSPQGDPQTIVGIEPQNP